MTPVRLKPAALQSRVKHSTIEPLWSLLYGPLVTRFGYLLHYSKTCVKWPLKNRQNKDLNDKWYINEGRKYCRMLPLGAFCNIFVLHLAIIGLDNKFVDFLRVAVLHRFYCMCKASNKCPCWPIQQNKMYNSYLCLPPYLFACVWEQQKRLPGLGVHMFMEGGILLQRWKGWDVFWHAYIHNHTGKASIGNVNTRDEHR